MEHRRFGRTELSMPVFSLGGMRFQQGWKPDMDIEEENQRNLEAVVRRALELGITHIETARGYGTSELQLGPALRGIPRDDYILQTKIGPKFNEAEFRSEFEKSLSLLGVDHVDLLALHGINDEEALDKSMNRGNLEAALDLKRQGRARFVGFSTHATTPVIVKTIETGQFDFINFHWFYIDQSRWPVVQAATDHDMGVFIISPSQKGGNLYEPPDKLVELCEPLPPIQFNDLFTLSHPEIHTLSVGAAEPSDFDEHVAALERWSEAGALTEPIKRRLDAAMFEAVGEGWAKTFRDGLPRWQDTPGEMALETIQWLWSLAKAYDMVEYAKMRYNLLGNGGSWFPGYKADKLVDGEVSEGELLAALKDYPHADRVAPILEEAHELLEGEEQKRLSESD